MKRFFLDRLLFMFIGLVFMALIASMESTVIIVVLECAVIFGWGKCWRLILLPIDLLVGEKIQEDVFVSNSIVFACDVLPHCYYSELLFHYKSGKKMWLQIPRAYIDENQEEHLFPQKAQKLKIRYYRFSKILLEWDYEDSKNSNLQSVNEKRTIAQKAVYLNHTHVYNIAEYYKTQFLGMGILWLLAILSMIVIGNDTDGYIGVAVLVLLGGYVGGPILLFPLDKLVGKQSKTVSFVKVAAIRSSGVVKTRYCYDLVFDDLGHCLRLRTPTVYTKQEILAGGVLPEKGYCVSISYYKYSRILLSWNDESGASYR